MSVRGAFPTTFIGPTVTEQFPTGACNALGQPAGDHPTGEVGLAHLKAAR